MYNFYRMIKKYKNREREKKKKRLSLKLSQRVVQISSSKNNDPMKTRSPEVYTVQAYISKVRVHS